MTDAQERADEQRAARKHDWHFRFGLWCCRKCGIVRRADGTNKPCKGVVSLRPFEGPSVPPQTPEHPND